MKKLRWQIIIVVIALIAIAVLLISQQPTVLPGVEQEPEPVSGGLYTEALVGEFGRLNPLLDYNNPADQDIDRLLYSSLIRFDDRGVPWGDLADTWGISQEGNVYNLSIRPEAVWHDGEPLTSEDIVFTVDTMLMEGMPTPDNLKSLWEQVEVIALNENTVQFRLPEPFAPFLDYLTFGVIPKHLFDGLSAEQIIDSPFNLSPIGSGPYRFERLITEEGAIQGVLVSVFEDYHGSNPYIEQITFTYFPDHAMAMNAYQNGEVMGINQLDPETLKEALREPELNLYTGRLPDLALVLLNLDEPSLPFFEDSDVREALLMGINRQKIINEILSGQGVIAHGPILPDTWAYYEEIKQFPFDPDQAIEVLQEAGYTIPATGGNVRAREGIALAFELIYPDQEPFRSIAASIQKDWERIGVKAVLKAVPAEEIISDYLDPRSYDAALVEFELGPSPDPDPYPFWHQTQVTGGQNYSQWNDRQASEFLEQARVDVDPGSRTRLYRNFQVRFTQQLPALPLFHPVYSYAVDQQVQAVQMGPVYVSQDRFNTISDWFLLARQARITSATPTPTTQP
jgi:peptide/nickel transport system substrate-binding protein